MKNRLFLVLSLIVCYIALGSTKSSVSIIGPCLPNGHSEIILSEPGYYRFIESGIPSSVSSSDISWRVEKNNVLIDSGTGRDVLLYIDWGDNTVYLNWPEGVIGKFGIPELKQISKVVNGGYY